MWRVRKKRRVARNLRTAVFRGGRADGESVEFPLRMSCRISSMNSDDEDDEGMLSLERGG